MRIAGRYELRERLGKGASGATYAANDLLTDDQVTVKVVPARPGGDRGALARELVALRGIVHPRIVEVRDLAIGAFEGRKCHCLVSRLVPGVTLDTSSARPGTTGPAVRVWLVDVLSALALLHANGRAHGDVKGSNIVVGEDGRATLIDFGCSRPFGTYSDVYGTLDHMSPETLGGEVSSETDLFALGVMLKRVLESASDVSAGLSMLSERLVAQDGRHRLDAEAALDLLDAREAFPSPVTTRASRWVGRDAAMSVAMTALEAVRAQERAPRVVSVEGAPGSGRSRFLLELRLRLLPDFDVFESSARGALPIEGMLGRAVERTFGRGIAQCLEAVRELDSRTTPTVFIVDDADLLPEADATVLVALARSVRPDGKVALIVAGAPAFSDVEIAHATLSPWTKSELASFLGGSVPAKGLARIHELSRGLPKAVVGLAGDRPAALLTEAVIEARREYALPHGKARVEGGAERRALALVHAAGGALPLRHAEALGVAPSVLDALLLEGILVRGDGKVSATVDVLDGPATTVERQRAHHELAVIEEREGDRMSAAAHRVAAGESGDISKEIVALLSKGEATEESAEPAAGARGHEASFQALVRALEHAERYDALVATSVSSALLRRGEARRALAWVARGLKGRPRPDAAARLRAIGGGATLLRGETRRAVGRLSRAARESSEGERPAILSDLALALLRAGQPARAFEVTGEAGALSVDVAITRSLSAAYLGRLDEAEAVLGTAESSVGSSGRGRVRFESARGFLALKRGEVLVAAEAYRHALRLAEEESLDDLVVPSAQNGGTASHLAGELGAALEIYERGDRMARAMGQQAALVSLGFNRGKLLGDIGALGQSTAVLQSAMSLATAQGMTFFEGVCHQALADGLAAVRDFDRAAVELRAAMEIVGALGAEREMLEARVLEAEIALGRGDTSLAALLPAAADEPPDLGSRVCRVKAEAHLRRGERASARGEVERALTLAEASHQSLLVADVLCTRAAILEAEGGALLSTRDLTRAREIWEGVIVGLPPALKAAFREVPRRRAVLAPHSAASIVPSHAEKPAEHASTRDRSADRLRYLVEINRRIGGATTEREILDATLDAAIDLTRAERGFLLLREGATITVAAARNFDQERLPRSRVKFSHAVAKRVMTGGAPVVAVDALTDPRFSSSRSVHAMELKSVLCVPVGGRADDQKPVGALYVDFRYRAGAFADADVEVVRAFADQAGIALERGRLIVELQQRNRDLEKERAELAKVAEWRGEEIERLREQDASPRKARRTRNYDEIVGRGPAMAKVFDLLDRVVATDITVLIAGESGTGKELIARAIHREGARRDKPFVAVNCGALPPLLFEGELFGYRKGAFTGAVQDRPGLIAQAEGGTLFLDEIGELPLELQVKLLRVLQEREVQPLGAPAPVPVDVRLLTATHRDLRADVAEGKFREDLYYRIAVVTVPLPPLRERASDIPILAQAILKKGAAAMNRPVPTIDRSAERALLRHPFPGNVRELENVLTKAMLLADGDVIREADLGLTSPWAVSTSPRARGARAGEADRLRAALESTGWNVVETAKLLEIPRATFYRKLRRYGLDRPI